MKMAVVCANGKAGKWIVKEAMARGLDVTAVVRGENRTEAKQALVKDLYDLTAEDLKGFDVVVDAFGAWTSETLPQHSTSLKHLCDILSGTDVRLLVVGGAGSLYVNPEHTAQVMDSAARASSATPTTPSPWWTKRSPETTSVSASARSALEPSARDESQRKNPRIKMPLLPEPAAGTFSLQWCRTCGRDAGNFREVGSYHHSTSPRMSSQPAWMVCVRSSPSASAALLAFAARAIFGRLAVTTIRLRRE